MAKPLKKSLEESRNMFIHLIHSDIISIEVRIDHLESQNKSFRYLITDMEIATLQIFFEEIKESCTKALADLKIVER